MDGPVTERKAYIAITKIMSEEGQEISDFEGQTKIVSTNAYTGIAATLLSEEKTSHRTFCLLIFSTADSTSSFLHGSKAAVKLREVDILIWDETPMAPRYYTRKNS
ncbi:uncharacterized protein [Fopius arisanus]|uniref:ATP-dependent DNA helicase n=1 Tax=Fopius arisanus TaxID=64838 RepID=A0A9R1T442_9HYME|nr:PREDICTED: uncharacterized protein LOC105265998 isoform X1 [Fopius arisanus]